MLQLKNVRPHKTLFMVIGSAVVVSAITLGLIVYTVNNQIRTSEVATNAKLAAIDKQISKIKAQKLNTAANKQAASGPKVDSSQKNQSQGQTATSCAIREAHGDPSSIDVLINKKHCFSPIDYSPSDLTSYQGYVFSSKIYPDLMAMLDAAAAAGRPIDLYSSYRSYANQLTAYNNWVKVNGSTAAADTVSARPGYSEHQTGFALDLAVGGCRLECFKGTPQYEWLQDNAATYGFIERYPVGLESITGYSPEAWHWRYVGPDTAKGMKAAGVKTLEQYWNISGGNY